MEPLMVLTFHGVRHSTYQSVVANLSGAILSSAKPCAKSDVGPEGGVSDMRRRWALVRPFTRRAEERSMSQRI